MNDLDLFSDPSPDGHLPADRMGRRAQKAVRRQQRRKRAGGRAAVLFALAFLVAVGGSGLVIGYAVLDGYLHPPDYQGQGTGEVTIEVKDGDLVSQIGTTLEHQQVVKSARAFNAAAKTEPKASTIQPGFYRMRRHMSAKDALALLLNPVSRTNQITIQEGLRLTELLPVLAKKTAIPLKNFQKAVADPSGLGLPPYAKGHLDGYLFPARYDVPPKATARDVLKLMITRFKQEVDALGLEEQAKSVGLSPGQVVTLASLLQAEGGTQEDYPKIARVIYNRIEKSTPLRLDTTVLYALDRRTLRVYNKDLRVKSPYNTYLHKGLPLGAIDSPGTGAINAALHPAQGNWMYFVTTDPSTGHTEYGVTDADFARLKAKLDQYLKTHR
jgi:peptidoglycan lytic transglycosylase G